ncbi:class I SAM-dependent methyltransferase [Altererythrobacter sp. BO-6]|uniref:class I SAM-dependent methyltransferase n=1 Tax=Altererythrobacter sp. BO-6 TaxID=2604537 RepID=UPI0013E14463|nr:class I SAM-dependent methyltransferase [Altererythrobacter sp. BO-6]QIG53199.1 class I SAM-dependent methyltransferase [Altererythrobacter sp. BO-6]
MQQTGKPEINSASALKTCRHCLQPLVLQLADLGFSPVANDFIGLAQSGEPEVHYPLEVRVCDSCLLAQVVHQLGARDLFRADYTYYSSHSSTWLEHARSYVETMIERLRLDKNSRVVEIASNDGYLLQYVKQAGIECLGIEPTEGPAAVARKAGLEVRTEFFSEQLGRDLANEGWGADLLVANNVLAHVPDINDFVRGAKALLNPEGVATYEVQHLLRLMQQNQFDTIYHEHFSYLSLLAAERIFHAAGLRIFAVESLTTHGGSVRFHVCHADAAWDTEPSVDAMRDEERRYGLERRATYTEWSSQIRKTKLALVQLCMELKKQGKSIAAYGAPAKGVTLLNYCGIGSDVIDFAVDRAPSKQGKLMPGVRVPIYDPAHLQKAKPDFILILPWNLKEEIKEQIGNAREWGGQFIVPVPEATIEQ